MFALQMSTLCATVLATALRVVSYINFNNSIAFPMTPSLTYGWSAQCGAAALQALGAMSRRVVSVLQ